MPDEQHRGDSGERPGATFWTVNPIWLFAIPTMAVGGFLLWPNPLILVIGGVLWLVYAIAGVVSIVRRTEDVEELDQTDDGP